MCRFIRGILGVLGEQVVALLLGHHLEGQLVVVAQEDGPLARSAGASGVWARISVIGIALLAADGHEQPGHQGEVEAQVALVTVAEVVGDVGRPPVGLGQQDAARVVGVQLACAPAG